MGTGKRGGVVDGIVILLQSEFGTLLVNPYESLQGNLLGDALQI